MTYPYCPFLKVSVMLLCRSVSTLELITPYVRVRHFRLRTSRREPVSTLRMQKDETSWNTDIASSEVQKHSRLCQRSGNYRNETQLGSIMLTNTYVRSVWVSTLHTSIHNRWAFHRFPNYSPMLAIMSVVSTIVHGYVALSYSPIQVLNRL